MICNSCYDDFDSCLIDGYVHLSNILYQVNGSYFHGHEFVINNKNMSKI